jgi:hypothetical protein
LTPSQFSIGSRKLRDAGDNHLDARREQEDQIELFYLPSHSPQFNPEERLNADLKQEMGKRVPERTKAKLRETANDHMAMLEQNPERVMSCFQDRCVRYAA